MRFRKSFLAITISIFACASRATAADNASQAWQTLTNFSLLPPPISWQTNPPTQEQLGKFDDEQAARAATFADKARDFYIHFPQNTNAMMAQVFELKLLQTAVHFGATNRLAALNAREEQVAGDKRFPEQLRFESRLDLLGREMQARVNAGADTKTELEKVGRTLVQEFPKGTTGYQILIDLASSADLKKMRELGEVMANSGGPESLTEIGKGILRRADAVGKPLAIQFIASNGRLVNLTTLSNKVVLVDFWATWCPGCVMLIPETKRLYEKYRTKGFEVIGIGFDDDTNAVQKFIEQEKLPWPQYFGGHNENKFGKEYSVNSLPSAWLVDRKGIVQDIHGFDNLEAKIEKLMAQ